MFGMARGVGALTASLPLSSARHPAVPALSGRAHRGKMPQREGDGLLLAAAPATGALRAGGGQQPLATRTGTGPGPSPPPSPSPHPVPTQRLAGHRGLSWPALASAQRLLAPPQLRSALQEQERSIAVCTEVLGLLRRGVLSASELQDQIGKDNLLFKVGAADTALPGGSGGGWGRAQPPHLVPVLPQGCRASGHAAVAGGAAPGGREPAARPGPRRR